MTNPEEYILNLIKDALSYSDNPQTKVSSLLETAKRIAIFRQDFENLWWISLEFCCSNNAEFKRVGNIMLPKFSYEKHKELSIKYSTIWIDERGLSQVYNNGRMVSTNDQIFPSGIYELESHLDSIRRSANELICTQGMHPVDVYFAAQDNAKAKMFLNVAFNQFEAISHRIRRRVIDYLAESERQILYGTPMSNYYDENRKYVQARLASYDSCFNDYFTAIEKHLQTESQVDLQEALMDIRRVLLAFADIICPEKESEVLCSDGKKRKLSKDKYMNRIVYALFEKKGAHTFTEMLNQNIEDLSSRISKVNELACKGVHDNISPMEAKQCVIQMYALLGDLVRLLL